MKKFILPVAILIFILLALGVTLFLVKQRQDIQKKAAPATTLSFSPAVVTKNVGDTFTLNVMMDTSVNPVSAAELHINYPSATLQGISIAPGTMLSKVITPPQPTIGNGTATIILGAESATSPASGQGVLAVVTFKVLQASVFPIKVSLDPASQVGAYGDRGNVISSMQDATITIGSAVTATPTVTLTPVVTVTSSPAVTRTPTPTEMDQQEETTQTPTPTTADEENQEASTPTPTPTDAQAEETSETTSTFTNTSEQELTLTNPGEGQIITNSKPIIKGKAKPGTKIVITVRSEEQTITVFADENGNWQATPPQALENGEHTIIAQADGDQVSTDFTVGLPETATLTPTILMIFMGMLLLVFGIVKLATI